MNIENMEEISKEYFYIIEKKIDITKDVIRELRHHFMFEVDIPYHLRYGAANLEGTTLRGLQ